LASQTAQNFANHTRLDPLFHFFLLPVAAINIGATIWNLLQNPGLSAGWFVVLAIAGGVAVSKIRTYALKAQDRVIRLEERLRLLQLSPGAVLGRIDELTEPQLIALRFACDAELPGLAQKALAGHMSPKEIKQAIVNWRADYFRI
jgi:Family of unknown function (DUF6526)